MPLTRLAYLAFTAALCSASATPSVALPIALPDKAGIEERVAGFDARLDDLPPAVIAAFVAQQDRFFWERVRDGHDSTLTEEAIRFLTRDDPAGWLQASPLERDYAVEELTLTASPEEILTIYLNLVPLGDGVTGLTAATKRYFDKTPKALTPAEAAFLAAVAGSPEIALKPANLDRTKSQRDYILRQVQKAGALTEAALEEQLRQPMPDLSR